MAEHHALPHRRYNPLSGQWLLVSPHRTQRPWQGQHEDSPDEHRPEYDPQCYLCPGNQRAGGHANPCYDATFVFTNDFPALLPDGTDKQADQELLVGQPVVAGRWQDAGEPLFRRQAVRGTCRVVCFSPRHDLTLPRMTHEGLRAVIDLWADEVRQLGEKYAWVQVFENKGAIQGCSNPHPHGQIWAVDTLPNEAAAEDRQQRHYMAERQANLLLDYVARELQIGERLVVADEHWVVLVPFWAVWPFETLLLPRRRQILRFPDLTPDERDSLAAILKRFLTRYDNLFATSFPYSMGWHGAPHSDGEFVHWQLHAHFYPPLLRSATVKKFMVGYELLGEPQRDLTPELAATLLREASETHYRQRSE